MQSCALLAAWSFPGYLKMSQPVTWCPQSEEFFCSILHTVLWACVTKKWLIVQDMEQWMHNEINRDSTLCKQYFFFPSLETEISKSQQRTRYCSYKTGAGLTKTPYMFSVLIKSVMWLLLHACISYIYYMHWTEHLQFVSNIIFCKVRRKKSAMIFQETIKFKLLRITFYWL